MDATGTRIPMAILACLLQLVSAVMLVIPTLPFSGTFFAFYLGGTAYMVNPLIFGWANIILQRTGDDALRSVALYCMNIGSMVLYTFWGIVFYSAADAPYWKKGSIVLIVCCFVMLAYMWVVYKVSTCTGSGAPALLLLAIYPDLFADAYADHHYSRSTRTLWQSMEMMREEMSSRLTLIRRNPRRTNQAANER